MPVAEGSLFALLHEKAKLCIFTEEFLVSEAMNMSDRNYELYVEKKNSRIEGNVEGVAKTISVFRDLGASPEMIAEAEARLAALSSK